MSNWILLRASSRASICLNSAPENLWSHCSRLFSSLCCSLLMFCVRGVVQQQILFERVISAKETMISLTNEKRLSHPLLQFQKDLVAVTKTLFGRYSTVFAPALSCSAPPAVSKLSWWPKFWARLVDACWKLLYMKTPWSSVLPTRAFCCKLSRTLSQHLYGDKATQSSLKYRSLRITITHSFSLLPEENWYQRPRCSRCLGLQWSSLVPYHFCSHPAQRPFCTIAL